jgi:hypothetical protein
MKTYTKEEAKAIVAKRKEYSKEYHNRPAVKARDAAYRKNRYAAIKEALKAND